MTPISAVAILQTNVLADALNEFKQNRFSMQRVVFLMKKSYGINFDTEYEKLFSRLATDHDQRVEARGEDIDIKDVGIILLDNGITDETAAFRYLMNLTHLFDENNSGTSIANELNQLGLDASSDRTLTNAERDRLEITFKLLASNYNGIAKSIERDLRNSASERIQGWFNSRVWRVIRSVVVTATIGALVGSYVNPYVAIVGGVIMGAAALADASANNNCHFAVQCSGGWRQDCDTGECKPYAQ